MKYLIKSLRATLLCAVALIGGLCLLSGTVQGQFISGYNAVRGSQSYITLTGATQLCTGAAGCQDGVFTIALPWAFNFNGTSYTTVYMSQNGFITFGAAPAGNVYTPLSTAMPGVTGVIAAHGMNNNVTLATHIMRHRNNGTSYTFEWVRAGTGSGLAGTHADYMITLFQTTNVIEVWYRTPSSYPENTNLAGQVGIRGALTSEFKNLTTLTAAPGYGAVNTATASWGVSNYTTVNNGRYTWTPPTFCTPPTVQASALNFSSITSSSATASWTPGNGTAGRIAVASVGALSASPASGTAYTANSTYGLGSAIGNGFVVAAGAANTVNVTGLSGNVTYTISVFEWNAAGQCYLVPGLTGTFTTANAPMTYLSSTTTHTNLGNVIIGSTNQEIIQVQVVTGGGTLSPLALTSLTFNTLGSTNAAGDLANARVYYTGNASTFSTGTQFGTTVANPSGAHTVTGSVTLGIGTNYFWVAYDIRGTATTGNVVDAQCTDITVGTSQTPTVTSPAGNRPIAPPSYCNPSFAFGGCDLGNDFWIQTVLLGSLNYTNGACLTNASHYQDLSGSFSGNVTQGQTYTLTVQKPGASFPTAFAAWIDWNNNGVFEATEQVLNTNPQTTVTATASVLVPLSAGVGNHRMRVGIRYNGTLTNPCFVGGGLEQGEFKDFNIVVQSGCTPPAITSCPGNVSTTNDPGQCGAIVSYSAATASGSPAPTITYSQASGTLFPVGATTVTVTATNACGSSTCSFVVTVTDTENPTLTCNSNVTVNTGTLACSAAVTYSNTASDNCPGVTVTQTSGLANGAVFPLGTTTNAFTATDAAGNTATCAFTVTVVDNAAPTIACRPNATVQCNTSTAPAVTGAATATDNCGPVAVGFSDVDNLTGCNGTGTITRTWVATDGAGNTSSCVRTITVIDDTPPTAICQNLTVQLDNSGNASVTANDLNNGSTDNCGAQITLTIASSGGGFTCANLGANTLVLEATDACGNVGTCTSTVTVQDLILPTITCPQNATVQCNTSTAPAATGTPTASDNCGAPTLTFNDANNLTGCNGTGTIVRVWRATDAAGNTASCVQNISVIDNTPPTITTAASDMTVECDGNGNQAQLIGWITTQGGATATDNCGAVTWSVGSYIATQNCGFTATAFVTFRATDGCGNSSNTTATFRIVDTTPPALNVPPTATVQCNSSTAPAATGQATGQDACTIGNNPVFWINEIHYDNTGVDANEFIEIAGTAGFNVSSLSLVLYNGANGQVYNTVPLSGVIPNQQNGYGTLGFLIPGIENGAPDGMALVTNGTFVVQFLSYEGTFTATNGPAVGMTSTSIGVQEFDPGSSAVKSLALIGSGSIYNQFTWTNQNPIFNATRGNRNTLQSFVAPTGVTVTFTDANNLTGCNNTGTITRTWRATDGCGNSTTGNQTINVIDNTAPTALCRNVTVQLDNTGNGSTTAAAVNNGSTDNCGAVTLSATPTSFTCANVGANTVTLTVTDACGNTATCTATATVQDVTPPVALCQNLTVQLDNTGNASITAAQVNNGSSDACGIASMSVNPNAFNCSNAAICPTDLFISEYVEGTSSNKAIEIYNGTGAAVNLAAGGYQIVVSYNGGTSTQTVNLTGTVAAGDVYVLTDANANAVVQAQSDQTAFNLFNGDDAVTLRKSSGLILDIIGQVGCDPGTEWTGGGNSTLGRTLRRNGNIASGVTVNPTGPCSSSSFPTIGTEWTGFPLGDYTGLGAHGFTGCNANTVVLTVTDPSGNTGTCAAQVTVRDVTPPAITCPANVTIQCNTDQSPSATGTATGSDVCSSPVITFTDATSLNGCNGTGTITRTWRATDASGNFSTCVQTITVIDNTPPTIVTAASSMTVECDGNGNQAALTAWYTGNGGAMATDNCGSVTWTQQVVSTSQGCGFTGTATVRFIATDACGNSSSSTATFTIVDTTPPSLNVPSNATVQCNASTAPAATGQATATDACTIGNNPVFWINEIHYDNTGADANEFIEIAGTAGFNVSSLSLVLYNGANGQVYNTVPLTGVIPNQQNGYGTLGYLIPGIENGAPDGIALVTNGTFVVQFLSYEGTFMATNGPAAGQTSTSIGVQEFDPGTASNKSVFLAGNGSIYNQFFWVAPNAFTNATRGARNTGQNFVAPTGVTVTFTDANNLTGCNNTGTITRTWRATDGCGNTTTGTQTINVVDNTAPTAICQNVTVDLDNAGNGATTAAAVNNGSSDNCGAVTTALSNSTFTCANVGANAVTLTVSDACGNTSTCSATVTVRDITPPTAICQNLTINIASTGSQTVAASSIDNGSSDACGIASLSLNPNTFTCDDLGANTVTLTVTDVNGNSATCTSTVTVTNDPLIATTSSPTFTGGYNISCHGGSDGSATVTATGGCLPYTYLWSNGQTTATATGLSAGTYTVTVTDVNGTTATSTITLTEPPALVVTLIPQVYQGGWNISCNGASDGMIFANVSGGTPGYSFQWNNGASTQMISGLTAGTYDVQVTDANGCFTVASITLTEPPVMTDVISAVVRNCGYNISCNGANDGSIDYTVSGGTAPYAFIWSNGATTEDLSGLAAGTYSVTATDRNGCTVTNSITLTEPAVLTAAIGLGTFHCGYNVSCNGASDGSAVVTATGGCAPYTYTWSTGGITSTINGLPAMAVAVTVTDANGCQAFATDELTEPAPLQSSGVAATYPGGHHVSCNGASDGSIDLTVTGGAACQAYSYAWSNGATTEDVSGLSAGTYAVTVTDANGCSISSTFTLTEPAPVVADAGPDVCVFFGYQTVNCTTLVGSQTGGVAPYAVRWNIGSSTGALVGTTSSVQVCPTVTTTYCYTVTDVNGCTHTDCMVVNVTDVRCGNNLQKITICHNPPGNAQTLCVAPSAVGNHINGHGDHLGACGAGNPCAPAKTGDNPASSAAAADDRMEAELTAFPNPFSTVTTVRFSLPEDGAAELRVYSLTGEEVAVLFDGLAEAGHLYELDWKPQGVSQGIYFAKLLTSKGEVRTMKLVLAD